MAKVIVFYVTGHGYGHARRSAQIMAAVRRREPAVRVVVRSVAPGWIFQGVAIDPADIHSVSIDPGVAEIDAMTIDAVGTARRIEAFFEESGRILESEVAAVGAIGSSLIVSDIGWLAGEVAERLGVPCVASGNFTWDYMYEPMIGQTGAGREMLGAIRAGYGKMAAVLRQTPFAHEMPQFRQVIDVPIVARRATMTRDEAGARLGLRDARPRVLIGMRGGTSAGALAAAARGADDFLFTTMEEVPGDGPENLRRIDGEGMDFTDVLAAHDVIVTKLGYGIVADCVANQVRLLWPPRTGFSEDALFLPAAPRMVPMRQIGREDFAEGRWRESLLGLMENSRPAEHAETDGAEVSAAWLLGLKI